jgi:hypothetical protein
MRRVLCALLFVALAVLWALPSTASAADTSQPSIFGRTAKPYGVSYGVWTERYWNWVLGPSPAQSPLAHPERCANFMQGKVFFITNGFFGTTGHASCTVPAGTPLLISPGGGTCDTTTGPATAAELRACDEDYLTQFTAFDVTIDTVEVPLIERYRFETPAFKLVLKPDNLLGVRAGTYQAVAISYTLLVRPLPKGVHTIVVHDELVSGQSADFQVRLRVV